LVRQAVKDALANEPAGLILDLRGNPGGLLEQAVEVASVFLEDKDVLIERFADGTEEVYTTRNQAEIQELPLVVLVNGPAPAPAKSWPARCRITNEVSWSASRPLARAACNCRRR
jgi:carboxyl-terminal processing protease